MVRQINLHILIKFKDWQHAGGAIAAAEGGGQADSGARSGGEHAAAFGRSER
jgi:hypothetical protein